MAFDEHKQPKFRYGNPYADYEYVNKNSRKTGPGLVFGLLFGLCMWVLAVLRWQGLAAAEETGDTVSLTTLEWGLYKVGGKWAIAGILVAFGFLFIYMGIANYRRLEKMKRM
jgi:uncharacterized membrane protein YidH (DUF202 family)